MYRIEGLEVAGEDRHIGLADDDRAGVPQAPHGHSVDGGYPILQHGATAGGRHPGHVEGILDGDRQSLERTRASVPDALVRLPGGCLGAALIAMDDGVDGRVHPSDAPQGERHQLGRRELPGAQQIALRRDRQQERIVAHAFGDR